MDLEEVKALIDMLDGTDITELNIKDDNIDIKIKKGVINNESGVVYSSQSASVPEKINLGEVKENENKASQNSDKEEDNLEEIVAPMVGTFYRSPAPDADPFIEVGDTVKEGDTLCIIEAMKLMNEIEAETEGKVVEILVNDSEPVEYGQPLFQIEKT
ncbi:MAG: acetyl-CoA carboxylase biotin carboxyl carrier protein [Halanaerobiales bacterium]